MSDDNGRRLPTMPNPQMRAFYVIAVTVGFIGTLTALQFHEPPEAARGALNIMLGSLGTQLAAIGAWFFRRQSPRGSRMKGEYVRIVDQVTQSHNTGTGLVVSAESVKLLWRLLTQLERGGAGDRSGP